MALAPYAPLDPRDWPMRVGSPFAPPFPDILIAAGRRTVPVLRALRRAARGKTFTVFLEDPRVGASLADLIWVPQHDRLRGPNVIVTPTTPHPLRPDVIWAARKNIDPRIAALPSPRAAIVIGGPSAHYRFTPADDMALADAARMILAQGFSLMATPSRRTAPSTVGAVRAALSGAPERVFFWDGEGANPYAGMIANADAILVTGDSVNMVSEALATGAPSYVYEPAGGAAKTRRFLDGLIASGHLRRWNGVIEQWRHEPLDATGTIAAFVAARYEEWRALLTS